MIRVHEATPNRIHERGLLIIKRLLSTTIVSSGGINDAPLAIGWGALQRSAIFTLK